MLVVAWWYHRSVCELRWSYRGGTIEVKVSCAGRIVAVPEGVCEQCWSYRGGTIEVYVSCFGCSLVVP